MGEDEQKKKEGRKWKKGRLRRRVQCGLGLGLRVVTVALLVGASVSLVLGMRPCVRRRQEGSVWYCAWSCRVGLWEGERPRLAWFAANETWAGPQKDLVGLAVWQTALELDGAGRNSHDSWTSQDYTLALATLLLRAKLEYNSSFLPRQLSFVLTLCAIATAALSLFGSDADGATNRPSAPLIGAILSLLAVVLGLLLDPYQLAYPLHAAAQDLGLQLDVRITGWIAAFALQLATVLFFTVDALYSFRHDILRLFSSRRKLSVSFSPNKTSGSIKTSTPPPSSSQPPLTSSPPTASSNPGRTFINPGRESDSERRRQREFRRLAACFARNPPPTSVSPLSPATLHPPTHDSRTQTLTELTHSNSS